MFQQPDFSQSNPIVDQASEDITLPNINIEQMISANLFGQAIVKEPLKAAVKKPEPVIETKLQLSLLGTVVAQDRSAAFIKPDKTASESVFFIGDRILPGVTLISVDTTHIIVSHNNRHKKIMLESDKSSITPLSNINTVTNSVNNPFPLGSQTHQAPIKPNNSKTDFLNMIALSGLVPQTKAGQFLGVAVNSVIPNTVLYKAGLKKGDLIQSINGNVLKNSADIKRAYDNGKTLGYLNIVFIRNGQSQTVYQPTH